MATRGNTIAVKECIKQTVWLIPVEHRL